MKKLGLFLYFAWTATLDTKGHILRCSPGRDDPSGVVKNIMAWCEAKVRHAGVGGGGGGGGEGTK